MKLLTVDTSEGSCSRWHIDNNIVRYVNDEPSKQAERLFNIIECFKY